MIFEHQGERPQIHETAYVAPTATLCGDVSIGANSRILFGAVVVAEGGPVVIGNNCIIMENAIIRGTRRHPAYLGDHVLVGPHAHLSGCTVEDSVFVATGASVFNGAHLGKGSEIRINGIVHIRTVVPPDAVVPISWIAIGDPCAILPPNLHEEIWAIQEPLDFPMTTFGLERAPNQDFMPKMTTRYAKALRRHADDQVVN